MHAPGFTYLYDASALGLGGVLKHRNGATTIIPSLASVALAPTGGEGCNEISNYDRDGVSFSNARSSVRGYDSAYRTFTTCSDVYISNLNLFGRVKVALLQMSISSTRDVLSADFTEESNPDKARFWMHALIRGLTIDDVEVVPQFDIDLCESPTYDDFRTTIAGRGVGVSAQQFGVDETELQTVLDARPQPIRASFVSDLQHRPTDKFGPRRGFKLPVKNFGNVHFGELVVKPGRRRVNLLRIEFDSSLGVGWTEGLAMGVARALMLTSAGSTTSSPDGGSATIMSLGGNGAPSWP
jgi:hypothetical protein